MLAGACNVMMSPRMSLIIPSRDGRSRILGEADDIFISIYIELYVFYLNNIILIKLNFSECVLLIIYSYRILLIFYISSCFILCRQSLL